MLSFISVSFDLEPMTGSVDSFTQIISVLSGPFVARILHLCQVGPLVWKMAAKLLDRVIGIYEVKRNK